MAGGLPRGRMFKLRFDWYIRDENKNFKVVHIWHVYHADPTNPPVLQAMRYTSEGTKLRLVPRGSMP